MLNSRPMAAGFGLLLMLLTAPPSTGEPAPPTTPGTEVAGLADSVSSAKYSIEIEGGVQGERSVKVGDDIQLASDGGDPDPCIYTRLAVASGDPRLAGDSPDDGMLILRRCAESLSITDGTQVGSAYLPEVATYYVDTFWMRYGEAPPPLPPPDPAVLAQEAVARLQVPPPSINFGPDPEKASVNYPVWLWIDDPGEVSTSVSLRGVTVTATATVETVTWSMGEPQSDPDAGPGTAAAPVVCEGLGAAPTEDDLGSEPACGYTYTWKSTAARTGGSSKWPVTANVDWVVNWESNTGVTGQMALESEGATALTVGEWKSVLVAGDGGN